MPTHWLLKNLSRPHFLSFLRMEAIYYPSTQTFLVLPHAFIPHEGTSVEALKRPCGRIAIYDRFDGILCCKLFIHSELKRMVFWLKLNGRNATQDQSTHKKYCSVEVTTFWGEYLQEMKKSFFVPKLCRGTILWRKTSRRKNLEIFWMNSKTIIESGFSDDVKNYFYMSSDSFVLLGGNILHNPRINCLKRWVRLWVFEGKSRANERLIKMRGDYVLLV